MFRTILTVIASLGAIAILIYLRSTAHDSAHSFFLLIVFCVIAFALYRRRHPNRSLAATLLATRGMTDEEAETFVTGKLSQNELDRQAAYERGRPERERIANEREERWRKTFLGRFVTEPIRRWFDKVYDTQRSTVGANALSEMEARAAHGDAAQQYKVGLLYEEGVGTPQDIAKAVEWYRKAAAQGHAEAAERVAVLDKH